VESIYEEVYAQWEAALEAFWKGYGYVGSKNNDQIKWRQRL